MYLFFGPEPRPILYSGDRFNFVRVYCVLSYSANTKKSFKQWSVRRLQKKIPKWSEMRPQKAQKGQKVPKHCRETCWPSMTSIASVGFWIQGDLFWRNAFSLAFSFLKAERETKKIRPLGESILGGELRVLETDDSKSLWDSKKARNTTHWTRKWVWFLFSKVREQLAVLSERRLCRIWGIIKADDFTQGFPINGTIFLLAWLKVLWTTFQPFQQFCLREEKHLHMNIFALAIMDSTDAFLDGLSWQKITDFEGKGAICIPYIYTIYPSIHTYIREVRACVSVCV